MQRLFDLLILTANGLLVVLYWLWSHLPVALTWPLAAGVVVLLDGDVSRRAGHRPRRYGRGRVQRESVTAYLSTPLLALLWTVVGLAAPPPIPLIGLAMWACLLLVPLTIPMEREHLLSRLKWMLATYAAAVGAFLLLLKTQLSPAALAAWSRSLGRPGAGAGLEAAVVSSVVPYAALMLWVVGPLMYFGYVAQRFAVHAKTRVSPWATVEERIRRLRGRGEVD
ncbi:MAG TPA: hypothetical protein G4O00_13680 [Thermoflexia bacterium]|nr:hypothetical protein [Thermoflexia bacterium]